jgi:hypothetical protein
LTIWAIIITFIYAAIKAKVSKICLTTGKFLATEYQLITADLRFIYNRQYTAVCGKGVLLVKCPADEKNNSRGQKLVVAKNMHKKMVSLSGSARGGVLPLSNCGTRRCATAPNGEHRSTARWRGNRRRTKGRTDGSSAKAGRAKRRLSPKGGTANTAAEWTWRGGGCGGCSGSELKGRRRSRRRLAEAESCRRLLRRSS